MRLLVTACILAVAVALNPGSSRSRVSLRHSSSFRVVRVQANPLPRKADGPNPELPDGSTAAGVAAMLEKTFVLTCLQVRLLILCVPRYSVTKQVMASL